MLVALVQSLDLFKILPVVLEDDQVLGFQIALHHDELQHLNANDSVIQFTYGSEDHRQASSGHAGQAGSCWLGQSFRPCTTRSNDQIAEYMCISECSYLPKRLRCHLQHQKTAI